MICNRCGKKVDNNSKFCPNCGQEVTASNSNNVNNSEISNGNMNNDSKKVNVGLVIVSFLIPLVGLILFIVKKDNDKKNAKACGISALIGFILGIVLSILLTVFTFAIVDNAKDKTVDILNDSNTVTEEDVDDNDSSNVSSDWDDYEFVVNGKTLELPCTYDELKAATGFSMKTAQEDSSLSNNYYTIVNMYKDDKLALYIEILNDTGKDAKYTDSKITRVSQTEYQVSNGADKLTFPGGLQAGEEMTEAKLEELFGKPTDKRDYSSDGYKSVTYIYNEDSSWTTTNYLEITIVNGVIDELTLDNRDYK